MNSSTFVWRDGEWVEKSYVVSLARSSLPAPMIIKDTTEPFLSHADGKMYDSKSSYYQTLKERGLRIVEEPSGPPQNYTSSPITEAEIGEAYQKVRDGYKPAPLEKEEI
jgi:hypothetical protein